jgi:DNA-directed RNA polymerase subunit RPC12/RpoP
MLSGFLIWIGLAIATGIVANSKGRDGIGWFFIGLIPIVGLVIALVASKDGPNRLEKQCPFCAEFIKIEAKVCKHCGRDLPGWEAMEDDDDVRISCPKCGYSFFSFDGFECKKCGFKDESKALKMNINAS